MNIYDLLKKHEGIKLKPYKDSLGILTIGIGRNLDDVGISMAEANTMLYTDVSVAVQECMKEFSWWRPLSEVRQTVIVDMVFNMGIEKFKTFHNTIAALSIGDFNRASEQMLDSVWAKQVGDRAVELSYMMKNDKYRDEGS